MPLLLPARLAAATRDLLVADAAVDLVVYDLAHPSLDGAGLVDPAARFAAVYRAPAPVSPGDFVVLGGFASDDAANAALRARHPGPPGFFGPDTIDVVP